MKKVKLYILFLTIILLINGRLFGVISDYKDSIGDVYQISSQSRIATTDFLVFEFLMALDKIPVGLADKSLYGKRVGLPPKLPKNIVDLGVKSQINLELLKTLNPDFLIIEKMSSYKNIDIYRKICPTIVIDFFDFRDDYVQNIFNEFKKFAKIFNKEQKFLEVEEKYKNNIDLTKSLFAKNNIKKAIYIEIIPKQNDDFYISVHAPKFNLLSELMSKVGLTVVTNSRALKEEKEKKISRWNFHFLSPEEFSQIDFDKTTVFLSIKKGNEKILEKFKEDLVIKSVLKNKNINPYVMHSAWAFGGPLSIIKFLENIQKSVTDKVFLH